jgi:pimeloyl-ACP methyl ester carboxylesterase
MRRIIGIATAAATALALGLVGVSSAHAQATWHPRSHLSPRGHGTYVPPPIQWGTCSDETLVAFGAQCGSLVVPLDYAHPRGKKISLAVSRVLHHTPDSQYQGVMLVNPGGPGGSGLIYSIIGDAWVPDHGGDSYDWIGFDPRGVGSSEPSLACDGTFFDGPRPPYEPTTRDILNQWVSRSKAYAKACTHADGAELFNHVKTTDTIADMESLRIALGQSKLNFYGFSYGTYLASVYMTLHPDRVRRFVLDSTVDPRGVWYRDNQAQDIAFQKTFKAYMAYLAQYHDYFDVGDTPQEVEDTFLATEADLNAHPIDGVFGGDELLDVFTGPAYYVYGWLDVGNAYSEYLHGAGSDDLVHMYTDANPGTPGSDNGYAMYLGTQCTDTQWPQSQQQLNRDNAFLNTFAYFFTWANAWFNGPCAYWKYPASHPVQVSGRKVHVPILMIGETLDPATPYAGSLYVRSIFPTASLIEGVGGTTHAGSLSGVGCTDDRIVAYLETGAVPTRLSGNRSDLQCPPVPAPVPTAATTATAGPQSAGSVRDEASARLRAGIEEAALHG